ncbi:MAG: zinc ribbon domain-containing protein, partial [Pseudonocardiaceae bacterium]
HELATLRRRQTVLEDELLEVMERREATAADLERGRVTLVDIEQRRLDAIRRRDAALAEVGSAEEHGARERRILIGGLPADLVSLYERIRARNGTGAALVREGRCGSCRLELDRTAIGHLREAASDEVVRCEECGVVLVRTPESGLSRSSDLSAESGR